MEKLKRQIGDIMPWIVIISIVLLPIVTIFMTSNIGIQKGQHTGYITAVETNQLVFTTHRAYFKTSNESTQESKYCVQDKEVMNKLKKISRSGDKAMVKYTHPLIEWKWNCSWEGTIITSVEILED